MQQENCDTVLTESHSWSAVLDSYRLFRRDRPRRRRGGVALYVRQGLVCLEHDDKADDRVEHLCIRIKGKANKTDVLMGVCCRSLHWDEEVNKVFYRCLGKVSELTALLLVGNFNLPDMCWKYNTADKSQSLKFLLCTDDNF